MKKAISKLRALIFDVDGTLADTERDGHRVAFNQAFADAGLSWQWSIGLYQQLLAVSGGKQRIRHYIDQHHPEFQAPGPLDDFIAGLHRAKTEYYVQTVASNGISLRPGVQRLLAEARLHGLRLAIATTTTRANVMALLKHSATEDISDWFDVIVTADEVPILKPAPDAYRFALDQLGLTAADCLAIEDSHNGLCASLGAGIATIVTVNDYTADQDFAGALLVVDNLGDSGVPVEVLYGEIGEASCVDVALLNRLYNKRYNLTD